jgi:Flp pilus assembly protein TadG
MGRYFIKGVQNPLRNQHGAYILITAIAVVVLFGFAALGIEVGRWYAIQGEMSKAIDGAAFAGAKNVNNPNISDLHGFVQEVAQANFPPGLLGTDTPAFTVSDDGNGKVIVQGSINSINTLANVLEGNHSTTPIGAAGSAKLRNAEIALVLDVSGSMGGSPLSDLKDGAKQFVENFEDQENDNRFALLTFASGVQKPFDMDHGYVSPITSAIDGLNANGSTNTEDALAQSAALPWTDQSGVPPNERTKQVVVFFSDGNPTAFRGNFVYKNNTYNGVAAKYTNSSSFLPQLAEPNVQHQFFPTSTINNVPKTGDGKPSGSSACGTLTVKWEIFSHSTYGLGNFPATAGLDPEHCQISSPDPLMDYHVWLIKQMAIDNAQTIKNNGIEIYTIGLGDVDPNFLEALSSGPAFAYYTPDSSELAGIFQQIANILKLVLIS